MLYDDYCEAMCGDDKLLRACTQSKISSLHYTDLSVLSSWNTDTKKEDNLSIVFFGAVRRGLDRQSRSEDTLSAA